jgi:N-acetylglucosaminyldiphosphoundecaprenol N-acetyl-beta-D-mannosaminyltransferase
MASDSQSAGSPSAAAPPPGVRILGATVSCVTLADTISRIEGWIRDPASRSRYIVATGFHGLWIAHQDPSFRHILNSADLFCPDGIAPVWISRLRGATLPERVPGPDILAAYLDVADRAGYRSFFYGDTDETLASLRERLAASYPGHVTAGTYSPPFRALSADEDDAIVAMINAARPDVLWIGLGLPKQERWIHDHLDRLRVPVVIGVGAAFGFLSGRVSRAPAWVGRSGLEWIWRLAAEPSKLWRRDLLDGPRFLAHVFLEMTGLRKYD